MKRHQVLIPISREHHQLLMMAQLLKKDAPAYRGLPSLLNHKLAYASEEYTHLIQPHLHRDEYIVYPFLREFSMLAPILEELHRLMEEIKQLFNKIEVLDEKDTDSLGIALEKYVRIKERALFQEAQQHLSESDFGRLADKLQQT